MIPVKLKYDLEVLHHMGIGHPSTLNFPVLVRISKYDSRLFLRYIGRLDVVGTSGFCGRFCFISNRKQLFTFEDINDYYGENRNRYPICLLVNNCYTIDIEKMNYIIQEYIVPNGPLMERIKGFYIPSAFIEDSFGSVNDN